MFSSLNNTRSTFLFVSSIGLGFVRCRYCIVLFAGIAAEGLVYGEAEGGESDENLYKGIISGLRPPWGPGRVGFRDISCYSLLVTH